MDFFSEIGFRDAIMIAAYLLMFGIVTKVATKIRDLHLWHKPNDQGENRMHCTAGELNECLEKMVQLEEKNQELMREHRNEMVKVQSIQNQVLRSLDEIMRRQWNGHRVGR